MKSSQRFLFPALAVAAVTLAACGRPADDTAAETRTVDPAVAAADKRADELRADAGRATDRAQANAGNAADRAQTGAANMADRAGDAVSDATITTSVNAALAADERLSALRIDVDTDNGVVTLKGPAPDEQARTKATELAASAKGVNRVENQLVVKK